jgi:DNA-binding CsgD family transcriptional regulator
MSVDERVLEVIEALYEAAMHEALWPHALKELSGLTNSQVTTFWVLDASENPRLPTFEYLNFDPKGVEEYLEHMAAIDPTVRYLVSHPNQAIVHDGLVITEREKDRHVYYDWHERFSDTRFRIVGQVHPAPSVQAGIALHRTRKAGMFESQDIKLFGYVHKHLVRALAMGVRLGSLGSVEQFTSELLDRNPVAILLLDEQRRIVYCNRAGNALRSNGDGIRAAADGIIALRQQDNRKLQDLITRALSPIVEHGASPGGVMRLHRPSGKRPYGVLVAPISRRYPALSVLRPAVCVVITDPDAQKPLPSYLLQAAFNLTEAESRLASLLAAGEDLRTAAEKLSITYGTARVRLAEIFQKTDTRRQSELIKLLLTTLGTF